MSSIEKQNKDLDKLNHLIEEADEIFRRMINRKNSKPIYKKALEIAKNENKKIEMEYIMGKIDLIDDKGDNALKHFENVINLDSNYFKAWHYIAFVISNYKKEPKKAIELYNKVTEAIPFADSWYNKGLAYFKLEKYKKSIECFKEVLKIDPSYALAWNSMSKSFIKLNRTNEAIESFEKAIELDPNHPFIRNNQYLPKIFLDKYDQARSERENDFSEEIKKIRDLNLSSIEETKKISEVEEEEKGELLELDALKEVISELEEDYDSILHQKKKYEKSLSDYLSPKESQEENPSEKNYLMVLRRWNSYTPAMLTDLESNVGGGYYINWKGKGIVIDPGFDFLDNFFQEKLIIDNIDAVIITHAHIDHCNDFEALLTLIYEFNENIENQKNYRKKQVLNELNEILKGKEDITKGKSLNFNFLNYLIPSLKLTENYDEYISTNYLKSYEKLIDEPYDEYKKKIDVFMNLGAMKKYLGWIPVESGEGEDKIKRVRPLEKGIEYKLKEYDIKIKVVEAKHNEVLTKTYSCGLILELYDDIKNKNSKSTKIGYTSDTKHVEKIEDKFKGVDIIIPHLGSIDENDFNLMAKKRNSNHLMLKGVISTIYRSKAKIAIISEFGEELKGYKIKIVKALNKVFQSHQMARCLTGDVGLKVYIPELTVNCFYESSSCEDSGRGINKNQIFEELNPENDLAEVIHFCKGCKNLYDDKKSNS